VTRPCASSVGQRLDQPTVCTGNACALDARRRIVLCRDEGIAILTCGDHVVAWTNAGRRVERERLADDVTGR
jgi:hypothetical protein